MALWGELGAMIDGIHLPLMTFTCNNNYKHNTRTVQATRIEICAGMLGYSKAITVIYV